MQNQHTLESQQAISQDLKWQRVENKKKMRNSPETPTSNKKQTRINDYWLNKPITTSNFYEKLEDEESQKTNDDNSGNNINKEEIKSPPIFVDGVENIAPLKQVLDKIAKDQYALKILKNNQIKIQPTLTTKYHPIMEALKQKETQGYTYQCKIDKKFKVVLRNMHPTIDTNELKAEIEAHDHKVIKITNILEARTKKPLPLFFIELQQKENNKDIYKIKSLSNTIITFEQPYKKRDIAQCTRCQAYGHTKNYCFRGPRCVKCAEKHLTTDCPRQQKFNEVKCYNCGGNHPASYKGCEVRKQIQQKFFPKLREKKIKENDKSSNQNNEQTSRTSLNTVQPNLSYAQALRENMINQLHPQINDTNNNLPQTLTVTAITEQQTNNKLEDMIMQLIKKMDSMLNLLMTVITKMK